MNAYDHLGRRTSTAYNYVSAWTETFAYATNLDYLTSATYSDNNNWNGTWSYDAAQNRSDVTTDILNRITGNVGADVAYVHNAVGERLKKTVTASNGQKSIQNMTWNDKGELIKLVSASQAGTAGAELPQAIYDYRYRADGLRVAKIGGPTMTAVPELEGEQSSYWDEDLAQNKPTWRYAYDGQMPIFEDYKRYEGGQYEIYDVTRSTLGGRGIDMIERQRMSDKNTNVPEAISRTFPLYDGHGNTMAELVRTGPTSADFVQGSLRKYDAWGNSRLNSAPSGFHGYCGNLGHKEDPESGLTYMRARYYEPGTGRFISEDPAGDGVNWYVYCKGDPVGQVDKTGKSSSPEEFALGFAMLLYGLELVGKGSVDARKRLFELRAAYLTATDDLVRASSMPGMVGSMMTITTMVVAGIHMLEAGFSAISDVKGMVKGLRYIFAGALLMALGFEDGQEFLKPYLDMFKKDLSE